MARALESLTSFRDVAITFRSKINKDVILKNVFVSHIDGGPSWVFTSPNGDHRFVFYSDEIAYIQISHHDAELTIMTTRDEVMFDFSDETHKKEEETNND